MNRTLIIDLADLTRIRLECGKCRAVIASTAGQWRERRACPECSEPWALGKEQATQLAYLVSGLTTLQKASDLGVRVCFEVDAATEQSK